MSATQTLQVEKAKATTFATWKLGAKTMATGLKKLHKTNPGVAAWVNFFSLWFVGGAVSMLAMGSTTLLPYSVFLAMAINSFWAPYNVGTYGFSRRLSIPRMCAFLPAMTIALYEAVTLDLSTQPTGYGVFLYGLIAINVIATYLDIVDIRRWFKGDRAEHPNTGFFERTDEQ